MGRRKRVLETSPFLLRLSHVAGGASLSGGGLGTLSGRQRPELGTNLAALPALIFRDAASDRRLSPLLAGSFMRLSRGATVGIP